MTRGLGNCFIPVRRQGRDSAGTRGLGSEGGLPGRGGRCLTRHLSRYSWAAMKDGGRKPAEVSRWIKAWGWDGGRLYRAGVMVERCFPDWEPASVIRGTEGRFTQRAQRLLRPTSGSGGVVSTPRALRAQRTCLGQNIPAHLCWREANLRRRSPEEREGKGPPLTARRWAGATRWSIISVSQRHASPRFDFPKVQSANNTGGDPCASGHLFFQSAATQTTITVLSSPPWTKSCWPRKRDWMPCG